MMHSRMLLLSIAVTMMALLPAPQALGQWAATMDPEHLTPGAVVTITLSAAPAWPVSVFIEVGTVAIGSSVIASAGGTVSFLLPAGSAGQHCEATFTCSMNACLLRQRILSTAPPGGQ